MCAGSLMFAVSTSRDFQFTVNWGADVVKFGAQKVLFSMPVASNLAPWGPSSDAGGRFGPFLEQQLCFLVCVFAGHVF